MSKILVIPDTHLKPGIFDLADQIIEDKNVDYCVQLGDNLDDFYSFEDEYRKHNARMTLFNTEHPNTVWLWGNHEVSYIIDKPVTGNLYCGKTYAKLYEENFNPKVVHIDGKYIFSHAGLFKNFIKDNKKDINDLIVEINHLPLEKLWVDESPIWARYEHNAYIEKEESLKDYFQIIGHTPVSDIIFDEDKKGRIISVDTFSTNWGKKMSSEVMIIIDTETDEIEILKEYGYRKNFMK